MSLPKELLDQLLSGYLDDALTADERVRVEQLLQSNAEIADELQQLRDLRRSLQVLSRVDSKIKLEQGFADRVLGAAVARAREEGLGDDHPLVRLAEQPSTSSSVTTPNSASWRMAAIMVGLAASIAIAVFVFRPKTGPDPGLVAKSDPVAAELPSTSVVPDVLDQQTAVEPGPMLAVDQAQPAVQNDVVVSDANTSVASSDTGNTSATDPDRGTPPVESIAASDPAAMTPEESSAVNNLADPIQQLGAILVVDVRRTPAGRTSDVVAKAMSAAEITPASRKEVTKQIAGFVAENVEDQSDEATVLYLQLPGKQFDLFYQQLWADVEGIESVRMTLAMKAPFLEVVDFVRPDPTTVRHESAAYELFSRSGVVDHLAHELGQLPFPEVDRRGAATGMLGSGPDVQAQVLVLVH